MAKQIPAVPMIFSEQFPALPVPNGELSAVRQTRCNFSILNCGAFISYFNFRLLFLLWNQRPILI